jgi:hypothetical protein
VLGYLSAGVQVEAIDVTASMSQNAPATVSMTIPVDNPQKN